MLEPQSNRLDLAIVQRGLARSRAQAQAAIGAGHVTVNAEVCRKSSLKVAESDKIILSESPLYVSRGGLKLAAALDAFAVDPAGLRCLDVGASTGGFTDCLLQRGAASVTAIDVGSGQMIEPIASDPRVILREHINARYIAESEDEELKGPFDLVVVDVSFISLTLLFIPLAPLFPNGILIALIKPQFEVGRGGLGPGGIVQNDGLRQHAVKSVNTVAESAGLIRRGLITSPITGGDGNIEFLAHFIPRKD